MTTTMASGMIPTVFFDCNSTTPTLPHAAAAALEAMEFVFGNPSSHHLAGLQAKHILENARRLAAAVLRVTPETIIFESGATEAIQMSIFSVLQDLRKRYGTGSAAAAVPGSMADCELLYSAVEHKAVPQAMHYWVKAIDLPCKVVEIPVDAQGRIDLEFLHKHARSAVMVATMAVNNETGVIEDLAAIANVLAETQSSALWLVDSVQALGKVDVPLTSLSYPIHYATFSGHKLYAPKGIGFLYARKGAPIHPLIVGGGQEKGMRSGTENLPGVAALASVLIGLLPQQERARFSCSDAARNFSFSDEETLCRFRDMIVAELKIAFPKIRFNTPFESAVPTCINFSVQAMSSKEIMDLFDSAGVRVSAGSACSSGSAKPSHVLQAMCLPEWVCYGACRLSFGPATTPSEIEQGCRAIRDAGLAIKASCMMCSDPDMKFEAPEVLRDGVVQLRSGASNSWIIVHAASKTAIVVDPVDTDSVAERIVNFLNCQNLTVMAIVDTHSHADHASCRPVIAELLRHRLACPLSLVDSLGWPTTFPCLGLRPAPDANMPEAAVVGQAFLENGTGVACLLMGRATTAQGSEGYLSVARLPTPGHTDDSQTFLVGVLDAATKKLAAADVHFAFVGDTILSGGLGRTNFVTSNPVALFHSLRELKAVLGDNTLLCPAHDYNNSFATRFRVECSENALLNDAVSDTRNMEVSLASFLDRKAQIDLELSRLEQSFQGMVCGVTGSGAGSKSSSDISISWDVLLSILSNTDDTVVIDVRESPEYSVCKYWNCLGLVKPPKNIPLSRFVNFMSEVLRNGDSAGDQHLEGRFVMLCRSGNRSMQAAKAMRRLGYKNAWNLEGGVATGGRRSVSG